MSKPIETRFLTPNSSNLPVSSMARKRIFLSESARSAHRISAHILSAVPLYLCTLLLATGCDESKGKMIEHSACDNISCGGHGLCLVNANQQPICMCTSGYKTPADNALDCVADDSLSSGNACEGVTCSAHGNCLLTTEGKSVCLCDTGYHISSENPLACIADITQPANACDGVTCSSHGSCLLSTDGQAVCLCDTGYHYADSSMISCAPDEEAANPCDSISCSDHGICLITVTGTPACLCHTGYHVNDAKITECIKDAEPENPCENTKCGEGVCIVTAENAAACLCNPGYHVTADNLTECIKDDEPVNPCQNGTESIDCGGNGVCVVMNENTAACLCHTGYHITSDNLTECTKDAEPDNPCESTNCGEGHCIVTAGNLAACLCNSGYHVTADNLAECIKDDEPKNPCESTYCGEGVCIVTANQDAACLCHSGYYITDGDPTRCIKDPEPPNPCNAINCHESTCIATSSGADGHDYTEECNSHGSCLLSTDGKAVCLCQTGYHHADGSMTFCDRDEAPVNPCENTKCGEGVCIVTAENAAACLCNPGYHVTTDNLTECIKDVEPENPCESTNCGEGICIVSSLGTAACLCNPGYHVTTDNLPECIKDAEPENPCKSTDCGGYGICIVTANDAAACLCNPGYHITAEHPDQCIKNESSCNEILCPQYAVCNTNGIEAWCECDANLHLVKDEDACVCDNDNGYYGTAGSCKRCEGKGYVWDPENVTCECDYASSYYDEFTETGAWYCKLCEGEGMLFDGDYCFCDNANRYYGKPGSCEICDNHRFIVDGECRTVDMISPWDIVYFGQYPQIYDEEADNWRYDPIEWIVLDVDIENTRLLLLSQYILDARSFHEVQTPINWYESTLYTWLSGGDGGTNPLGLWYGENSFVYMAFGGYFYSMNIPSIEEVRQYFTDEHDNNASRKAYATPYANTNATGSQSTSFSPMAWWLRSRGARDGAAAVIQSNGSISSGGYPVCQFDNGDRVILGVRPMMWLYL